MHQMTPHPYMLCSTFGHMQLDQVISRVLKLNFKLSGPAVIITVREGYTCYDKSREHFHDVHGWTDICISTDCHT